MLDPEQDLDVLLRRRPDALAFLHGSGRYPSVRGTVSLYQSGRSVMVVSDVSGLPGPGFFPLWVQLDPKSVPLFPKPRSAGEDQPVPAGALPPLISSRGSAFSAVLTDRFSVREALGRTVELLDCAGTSRAAFGVIRS